MTAVSEVQVGQVRSGALTGYAIEVEGLTLWHGPDGARRNLSLHVPYGSIFGLVGPSGAGKTATIRTLATVRRPVGGTVLVDGIDIDVNPAAVRRRIGYLPDFSGVYESFTLREYLEFYAEVYGVAARRQVADELLELVGLTDQRSSRVGALSRGMKQQLGLARCLIHDPRILLLDEPAAGMDPRSRLDLRDIVLELRRLGKTVLMCSHLLTELAEVCTHLGIMEKGELLAEGTTEEIMAAFSPETRLRIRLADPRRRDAARQLLEPLAACQEVEAEGPSTLLVRIEAGEHDPAAILEVLYTNGVRVVEFAPDRRTLEDVVLQVTEMRAAT